jgi:Protein of unknown function (DUF4238)
MARDHYVPALVLGRFSADLGGRARERRLIVGRRGKVFRAKAEDIGLVKGLYDVESTGMGFPPGVEDPGSVDEMISGYEPELPAALDLLDGGARVPLRPWLRVLVPFIAAMFARGKDFGERFEERPVVKASGGSSPDNTNTARLIDLHRLLAPVTCARWVVLHQAGRESFIINDLGLMPTRDLGLQQDGFAIPIGRHSVVGIFPQHSRTVAWYDDGGWQAIIEHRRLDAAEVAAFNRSMAECATEWIAGAEHDVIEQNVKHLTASPPAPVAVIMEQWPFDYKTLVAHDRDWHRLVSATAGDPLPNKLPDLQVFDPRCMAGGWCPPVVFALNMKEFPTGLRHAGRGIRLTLKTPDNYEDFFIRGEAH